MNTCESIPRLVCPLCESSDTAIYFEDTSRYFGCSTCGLIFLDPVRRLSAEAEKARYDLHQNSPEDHGYRKFLERLAAPLAMRLALDSRGLDYGAGPGPVLSLLFEERGYAMALYDPFYHPDDSVLRKQYGFITCSETAEHFYDPRREFGRLYAMLEPGGWLGMMTEQAPDTVEKFRSWYYRQDPTHVCFYSPRTLAWIAHHYGFHCERISESVTLFRKSG